MTIKYCNCPRNIPYHNKDCEFYVPPTTPIPEGELDVTTYWGNQIHQLNIEIINLRAALAAERARTLEEAAKVCEGVANRESERYDRHGTIRDTGDPNDCISADESICFIEAAKRSASSIRALASHPTQAENKNTTKEKI